MTYYQNVLRHYIADLLEGKSDPGQPGIAPPPPADVLRVLALVDGGHLPVGSFSEQCTECKLFFGYPYLCRTHHRCPECHDRPRPMDPK